MFFFIHDLFFNFFIIFFSYWEAGNLLVVYNELHRFPLYINSAMRTLNYWFKILQMNPNRLPFQAYQMLFIMDGQGKINWATNVRNILSVNGFQYVWNQQGVGNVNCFLKVFKTRLQDVFRQEWEATIRDKERYDLFHCFKRDFCQENYIVNIDVYCFRVALSHIRFGVLPLNNNAQRYNDNVTSRNCFHCKNLVENEYHFIYVCPLYSDLREKHLSSRPFSIVSLLQCKDPMLTRSLGKFVYHAFSRRKQLAAI